MSRSSIVTEDLTSETERLEIIPPGEILLEEFMKPDGISQSRLARDLDVNVGRIADIVHGQRPVTADLALCLARYFGTSAELWLGLQMEYEIRHARRELLPIIEDRVRPFRAA